MLLVIWVIIERRSECCNVRISLSFLLLSVCVCVWTYYSLIVEWCLSAPQLYRTTSSSPSSALGSFAFHFIASHFFNSHLFFIATHRCVNVENVEPNLNSSLKQDETRGNPIYLREWESEWVSDGKKSYEEIRVSYQKLWNVCCPVWNEIKNNSSDAWKMSKE